MRVIAFEESNFSTEMKSDGVRDESAVKCFPAWEMDSIEPPLPRVASNADRFSRADICNAFLLKITVCYPAPIGRESNPAYGAHRITYFLTFGLTAFTISLFVRFVWFCPICPLCPFCPPMG